MMDSLAYRVGKVFDGVQAVDVIYVCAVIMVHAFSGMHPLKRKQGWLKVLKFIKSMSQIADRDEKDDAEQKRKAEKVHGGGGA